MKVDKTASPDALLPIDWPAVELQYRAGIRSLRAIATEFGCTHAAIRKRALRDGWHRDLAPRIHALADNLVSKAAVSMPVSAEAMAAEDATVKAGAGVEVAIRLGHRSTAARAHQVAREMLATLKAASSWSELFKRLRAVLESGAEPTAEQRQEMREAVSLLASLPQRVSAFKNLVDALARTIAIERAAYGLDTASGSDSRPLVIVKDYTGRGDLDAVKRDPE